MEARSADDCVSETVNYDRDSSFEENLTNPGAPFMAEIMDTAPGAQQEEWKIVRRHSKRLQVQRVTGDEIRRLEQCETRGRGGKKREHQ